MGRVWTIEERQKQAERIRSQKPWLKSTGPRTSRGKRTSSHNAIKHGGYRAEFKMICKYLKLQKLYIDTLRILNKYDFFEGDTPFEISGNELNENPIKSIRNATNWSVKTMVKSRILTVFAHQSSSSNRHCEERSDEAIQNGYYTLLGLPRFARNDNDQQKTHPFGRAFQKFKSPKIIQRQLFSLLPFS